MSGHSKWATIKHAKGLADAKRGKIFTKFIKKFLSQLKWVVVIQIQTQNFVQ